MRIQVNLGDDMLKKVDEYAKMMGVTRSSLCALFIGQGCMAYDKSLEALGIVTDKALETIAK